MDPKKSGSNKFWYKKIIGFIRLLGATKYFLAQKEYGIKEKLIKDYWYKNKGKENLCKKNLVAQIQIYCPQGFVMKIFLTKNWFKNVLGQIFDKRIESNRILVQKVIGSPKLLSPKLKIFFVDKLVQQKNLILQNEFLVQKYFLDKCCQDQYDQDSCDLFKIVPETCLWILVQIMSVTLVFKTNVAWTNVTLTVNDDIVTSFMVINIMWHLYWALFTKLWLIIINWLSEIKCHLVLIYIFENHVNFSIGIYCVIIWHLVSASREW